MIVVSDPPTTVALESTKSRRRSGVWWLALIIGCCGLIGFAGWFNRPPARLLIVRCAETLLLEGKRAEALRTLEPLLQSETPDGSACFFAGQANAQLKQFAEAVKWLSQVPQDHPRRGEACLLAGEIQLLQLHQLSRAEELLAEAIRWQTDVTTARGDLAGLYGLCGLTKLSLDLRFERLSAGQFAEVDLLLLALGDTAAENAEILQDYVKTCPDDPLTQIALGHQAWQQHDLPTARSLYERGLTRRPDLVDAQARLGRILCEQSDEPAFLRWNAQLGAHVDEHPDIWVVRGDWSLHLDDIAGSVRCYWEAVRRDPAHRRAHFQLGQSLARLNETALAEVFQRRNADLQELLLAGKQSNFDRSSTCALRASTAAANCGHAWEAWGWAEIARRRVPKLDSTLLQARYPATGTQRVLSREHLTDRQSLDRFPLPRWMQQPTVTPTRSNREGAFETTGIQFSNDAERLGLQFQYISGDSLPGPGMRMFQFSGGGVGVLDYDQDGWPDLYFTQGGQWPVPEEHPPGDALFRNREGDAFENVTHAAGISETDYSQGLAVVDFNCDGWPDLLIANVAGNKLFQNNGDGTFQDVTQSAGVTDHAWSTSVVGADFNRDGLPDLFVVNYLSGPGLLDRICRQANGAARACTPHEFDAAEDQLLLNLGDGRFRDVTAEAGIIAPGGKGLGVVAVDFEQTGRLSLFVGNDTTANFFFHNQTVNTGDVPRFDESAIVMGLAFDREGHSQACMGIAADDANGDGQTDLFVTNYYNESNTLYLQQPGQIFVDATAEASLREPSLKQLGFGAQFLDADLDGWPDLVVTNGHVDDETARGIPLKMPTQVFRNSGKGRFAEVPASQLGYWFQENYLGRGLARLDWNRDGRDDFAVSIVDGPAALLTNNSPRRGRSLSVRLVGTDSARDPIGATVRVETGERTLIKQLTAGDGYQASNERFLVFGVGDHELVNVHIHWPSGRDDAFSGIASNAAWLAIEGRSQPFRIHAN